MSVSSKSQANLVLVGHNLGFFSTRSNQRATAQKLVWPPLQKNEKEIEQLLQTQSYDAEKLMYGEPNEEVL